MVNVQNKNRRKKILVFAGILGVPAFFIVLLAYGSRQKFEQLPFYGPKEVINGDTVYYKVPTFHFTDHLGNSVTNQSLEGKILLVTTAMPSCPELCPIEINQIYKYVYEKIKGSKETEDVVLLTHVVSNDTVTPDATFVIHDLPYENGADIDFERWKFIYGETNPIYDVFIEGWGNPYQDLRQDVIGGRASNSLIFLVDYKGHIRGFFPGISNPAIMEAERLATLLCIEKRNDAKRN
ncbi:MAG: SCO family protein [Flavobacteriales bacterium]|nr:SCO family protein [Flavobacteriales bacterium]